MPGNFWKQFGDTYDKVNQTLGGIPDFVKNQVAPRVQAGMANFDQAMTNSLPGVIGSAVGGKIANAIQPGSSESLTQDVNQQAQQGQSQYPVSSLIGQGAGLAAQMVNSPTVPAAAAGTAAAKLVPTIGRNLLTSAGMTIPGAIAQGTQTGDWGQAALQGAKDTALGGLLGAGSEKILGMLPTAVQALKKTLASQAIKGGLDVDSRALRKVATYGPIGKFAGTILDRADDLKQQLVDLMVAHPEVKTEAGRRAIINTMDNAWSKVDDSFNSFTPPAGMGKVRSFQDEILSHPLVKDALGNDPNMLSKLDEIIGKADNGKDLAATRHILRKDYMDPAYLPGSTTDTERVADLARGVNDVIDEHFVPDSLKATYARDKVLKEALSREDLKLTNATIPGSPTFARYAASSALGGLTGGAAGFDPSDPSAVGDMARNAILGGVIGGVGQRLISKGINKGMAGGEARLAQMLGKIPEGALQGAEQIAPRVAQAASRGVQMNQQNAANQPPDITGTGLVTPPQAPAMPAAEQQTEGAGGLGALDTTQLPTQPEPPKVAPEHAEAVNAVTTKEQGMPQDQVQAARQAVAAPFEDRIKAKILQDWQTWQNPYKADFDTFYDQARNATNNFDPKNINTAKIIGGPNYKDYLKSYQVALNIQSLGKDLSEAIGFMPVIGTAEASQKHTQLVNTLYTAMTGDMKEPDKTTRKSIENRIVALRRQRLTPNSQKSELMNMLQDEYGVRFDMLKQYGLI